MRSSGYILLSLMAVIAVISMLLVKMYGLIQVDYKVYQDALEEEAIDKIKYKSLKYIENLLVQNKINSSCRQKNISDEKRQFRVDYCIKVRDTIADVEFKIFYRNNQDHPISHVVFTWKLTPHQL